MSSKKKVAVFHNLPGGGSYRVMQQLIDHLVGFGYEVDVYYTTEKGQSLKRSLNNVLRTYEYKLSIPRNLIVRLIWILCVLPNIHKEIAKKINKKAYRFVLINHDYLTKSPYIIKFIKHKRVYVLHEPQRVYEPAVYTHPISRRIANSSDIQ